MSIFFLTENDFLKEGSNLVANIGGITFVMFHSQSCVHCVNFLPEFKKLPATIRGVNFALCDGTKIAPMSAGTNTPIKAVPKFILYNDGVPLVEFTGQRSTAAILKFLQDIIGQLQQKQSFARPPRTRQGAQEAQPMTPPSAGINRPMAMNQSGGGGGHSAEASTPYKVTPSTGVREYETSYGLPYNAHNEKEFLDYEQAYKQALADKKRG